MNWMIHAAALLTLLLALRHNSWALFKQSPLLQHLSLGGIAIISFIWTFSVQLEQGLSIHFLGITALTLMLGLCRTLIAGAIIILLNQAVNDYTNDMLSALYISYIVLPALVTYIAYAVVYHRLPRHPFVYIFVNAFITAALSIAIAHLSMAMWAWFSG